jgi:hypothetical protein
MNHAVSLHQRIETMQRKCFAVGAAGLVLCAVGGFVNPVQFFRSYLLAFMFWTGLALGCAAIVMLHHLTGGAWGFGIRRMLEAGTRTFPMLAVLFLPIVFGLSRLYPWAQADAVAADPLLQHKHFYLNVPFFIARAAIYFGAWNLLGYFLSIWSAEQDSTGDRAIASRFEALSGPGLIVYGLTATFAAIDWVMSLEPHWFSTIYGMMFMVSQALAAMSFVIIVAMLLADSPPLSAAIFPAQFHDLGNLLFAFTMLWAYLSFSQFLLVWSGNLQTEIPWYTSRASGGWVGVALFLIVFHFAVPFLLLLSRTVKRRKRILAGVAGGLLFLGLVDLFWLITPAFHREGPSPHWMDLAAPLGVGGIWLATFCSQLKSRSLLPLHDTRNEGAFLEGATSHGD